MGLIEKNAVGPSTGFANGNLQWWKEEDPDKSARICCDWFDHQRTRPAAQERRKQFLLYATLYGNLPVLGFGLNSYTKSATASNVITFNVIQNAANTLLSKALKQNPKATFLTEKGDYEKRKKAEDGSDFVQGMFYEQNLYDEVRPLVLLDCLIFGLGSYKTHTEGEEVVYERCFPFETVIDDREAMYGKPRTRGQRKYYDKDELKSLFAEGNDEERNTEIEEAIERGGRDNQVGGELDDFDYDETSNQILVYECWRLPSGKGKKDGRHIICIRNICLLSEPFEADKFPFTDVRFTKQWAGFFGVGVCEQGLGIQLEINRILRDIQQSMRLIAKPHWMVNASSNVIVAHLNNDIATIIKYQGSVPPTVYTPQAMSGEVFSHLQYLVKSFYEMIGVSQLSASSQKPAGLDSGVALATYLDIESERFTDFLKNDEAAIKDLAEQTIRAVKKLGSKVLVRAIEGQSGYRKITFKDVDLEDEYQIRVYPTSMLPDTPAGKLNFVSTMVKGQMLPPEDAFEMIDWPDTQKYAKRRGAARRVIEHNISLMRQGKEGIEPEPFDNHGLALRIVTEAYHEAREDGLPVERLSLFRDYINATLRLLGAAAPPNGPAMAPMVAGGDLPGGMAQGGLPQMPQGPQGPMPPPPMQGAPMPPPMPMPPQGGMPQ